MAVNKRKGITRNSKAGNQEAIGGAVMGAAAATAMPLDLAQSSHSVAGQKEIARLAYAYWVDRGCPDGSPDEDWFRAEKTLREQSREVLA
jgi:hypothetical protein